MLETTDREIYDLIKKEEARQKNTIELIASENFASEAICEAVGSCLTNKYTEGYPGHRYYGGCQYYDEIETICQKRWQQVFNTDYHVNVQPNSGSQANFQAYRAAGMKPGDTYLTLDLNHGGHLTHGSSVNFSGTLYKPIFYGVDNDGYIDMEAVYSFSRMFKPKVIMCGASAYPRIIDFKKFADIAHECGAVLIADISHIAGLIAGGEHPSPFGLADIITTTTHKTLRGPRGAIVFCRPEYAKKLDSAVFPYSQGGSLQHVIAGKAVAAGECLKPEFKEYAHQVVLNTKAMCNEFINLGYEVVTGGTDNHLFLLDFSNTHPNLTGAHVQELLDTKGITLNKNCVPNETRKPAETSGVRIGLAAMTTRGWKEEESANCAHTIDDILKEQVEE